MLITTEWRKGSVRLGDRHIGGALRIRAVGVVLKVWDNRLGASNFAAGAPYIGARPARRSLALYNMASSADKYFLCQVGRVGVTFIT
jgi:hypothetical protein